MGARRIPRPNTGIPSSPDQLFQWLEYLCLSSESRGLAGYELAQCTEFLAMTLLDRFSEEPGCESRAYTLRAILRTIYTGDDSGSAMSDPGEATLMLMGLTPTTLKQPRPARRRQAADAMGMPLDTFQKGYERRLLLDAAYELWRLELTSAGPA
jgi:hypothetical protein